MTSESREGTTNKRLPPGGVHPSVTVWAGCQGCRRKPLSPNLPDPKVRARGAADPE
jgi:hypothetical protein